MKVRTYMALLTLALGTGATLLPVRVEANHPVLVEGNNGVNGGPGTTTVPPGTSGDYDGDGLIGTAEDTDNTTDRIFGTLTAALLMANGGANANGHVIIVTSGRFSEQIRIPNPPAGQTAVNGVTIIEAAPGVQANIDAVLAGDAAGNAARQAAPGISINTLETDRVVILRNLVVRNFTVGLQVLGNARVTVEKCRFDSNLSANVAAAGSARLTMTECSVVAAGMRFNPAKGTPTRGYGVIFSDNASGSVARCTISSNTFAGVYNGSRGVVILRDNNIFDNAPDIGGERVQVGLPG